MRRPQRSSLWLLTLPAWLLLSFAVAPWIKSHAVTTGATASALNPTVLRMGSSLRLEAWEMFAYRVLEQPWTGYGIGRTGLAHLVGDSHQHPFGTHFQHAHNQVLEVLLWVGLPLGLLILVASAWLIVKALRWRTERHMLASGGMLVLLSHSMFEFPLYYSYFLLPFAVLLACNTVGLGGRAFLPAWRKPWLVAPALLLISATALLARDHGRLENLMLRWGLHQMVSQEPFALPAVSLGAMSHWKKMLHYSAPNLHLQQAAVNMDEFEQVARRFPTTHVLLNYAVQLTLHNRPEEAQRWLQRACAIHSERHCLDLQRRWERLPPLIEGLPNPAWPLTVYTSPTPDDSDSLTTPKPPPAPLSDSQYPAGR